MNKIQAKENQVYLRYANVLFDFFRQAGGSEGKGGFLMRVMRGNYSRIDQVEFLNYLYKILFNLCENGYLAPSENRDVDLNGWINLTETGSDYLNGGPLKVNQVNLNHYISLTDSDTKQFDDLWFLIGKEDLAPFYVKGPTFLNMVRPYVSEYLPEYNTYMNERKEREKSTSRRIWYKELYQQIKAENREKFLADLSYAISLSFYYAEEVDEDYMELFAKREEEIDQKVQQTVTELPELKFENGNGKQTPKELLNIALEICNAFKKLVEDNRLYRLLYNDDDTPKDETAAQLLFFSIAKGYCKNYDIDINRESDPGIGELDFKFSVGNNSKIIIEMKLSTNKKICHGFERQLPAYIRAEEASYGILLVVQLNKTIESELARTMTIYQRNKDNPDNIIHLVCVDATAKPSASNI